MFLHKSNRNIPGKCIISATTSLTLIHYRSSPSPIGQGIRFILAKDQLRFITVTLSKFPFSSATCRTSRPSCSTRPNTTPSFCPFDLDDRSSETITRFRGKISGFRSVSSVHRRYPTFREAVLYSSEHKVSDVFSSALPDHHRNPAPLPVEAGRVSPLISSVLPILATLAPENLSMTLSLAMSIHAEIEMASSFVVAAGNTDDSTSSAYWNTDDGTNFVDVVQALS